MKFLVLTIFVSAFSLICTDQPDVSGQVSISGTEKKSDLSQQEAIIRFRRINEPNEKAFTVLIPNDWKNTGGIFRVDANRSSAIYRGETSFALQKDKLGSIMMRWLPDMLFYDASKSPAGQMELFPPGSNSQGMTVYSVMTAEKFIRNIIIPLAYPSLNNYEIINKKRLDKL